MIGFAFWATAIVFLTCSCPKKEVADNEKFSISEDTPILSKEEKHNGCATFGGYSLATVKRSRNFHGYRPWHLAYASWILTTFIYLLGWALFYKNDPRKRV